MKCIWKSCAIRSEHLCPFSCSRCPDLGDRAPGIAGDGKFIASAALTLRSPWLVMGDFNEILYNLEKEGGRPRPQRHLQAFHDVLIWVSGVMGLLGKEG